MEYFDVVVGQVDCVGPVQHLTYVGGVSDLLGKTALVRAAKVGVGLVGAQFDDRLTGFGYGWHTFYKEDFK